MVFDTADVDWMSDDGVLADVTVSAPKLQTTVGKLLFPLFLGRELVHIKNYLLFLLQKVFGSPGYLLFF